MGIFGEWFCVGVGSEERGEQTKPHPDTKNENFPSYMKRKHLKILEKFSYKSRSQIPVPYFSYHSQSKALKSNFAGGVKKRNPSSHLVDLF